MNKYEYTPPDYLKNRADEGYSQQEKLSLFEQGSIPTIMNLLQKQRATEASMANTGMSGGLQSKALGKSEDYNAMQVENVWQGVEDKSLALQENALNQITNLEMQYKQTMLNRDLTLQQIKQQKDLANKQMWVSIGTSLLGLL